MAKKETKKDIIQYRGCKEVITPKMFVIELAFRLGITQKEAREIYVNFVDIVKSNLYKGNGIRISEIGSFIIKRMPATLKNIPRGDLIWIPEHLAPKFLYNGKFKRKLRKVLNP